MISRVYMLFFLPCLLFCRVSQLDSIAIFGNHVTRPDVIIREMETQPGHLFSDSLLISDRSWLIRSDFLEKIDFQLKPARQYDHYALLIVVQEKSHWSFSPSFHTNDLFGLYGGGTLKYRNLFGRRQQLDCKIEAGGKNRLILTWSDPWIFGSWHCFSSASVYTWKMPYPYHDYKQEFMETTKGTEIRIGKQMNRQSQIGLKGAWQHTETDRSTVLLSGNSFDEWRILGWFLTHDTRDWPGYPRHGILFTTGMDFNWISDQIHHYFGFLNFRAYLPRGSTDILAMQLLIQSDHGTIPVYHRLHLGGGNSVRGIATGSLAGNRIIMANLEYRFPILYERHFEDNLHVGYAGVFFFDIGSAWFSRDPWTSDNLRGAAGIGIHVLWDNYMIRGEYGFNGHGRGFLNIGTSVHF